MQFFGSITALAFVAVAFAQNSTSHSSTALTATSTSLSPQASCLTNCGYADICCQAACVNVPCPNQAQANATTECAGRCPQGNGTASDTQRYAQCQQSCISSYFLSATSGHAAAATSSGSMTATFGVGVSTTGSASRSGSAGASATASGNAAAEARAVVAGAGLLGLIVAGLAL